MGKPIRRGHATPRLAARARRRPIGWPAIEAAPVNDGAALGRASVRVCTPCSCCTRSRQSVQYSFYNWDGIGPATPAGLTNWRAVFIQPELLDSVGHAFVLIVFYTVSAGRARPSRRGLIRELRSGAFNDNRASDAVHSADTAAGRPPAWPGRWMYSSDGLVNQVLRVVGLGHATRAWLGDFTFALPAVGVIGIWVMLGFCTILLLVRNRQDRSGALRGGPHRRRRTLSSEFFAVTLPGLRRELVVCTTFTMIAALASFDVIQVSTGGGPGYQTMVPGSRDLPAHILEQRSARRPRSPCSSPRSS